MTAPAWRGGSRRRACRESVLIAMVLSWAAPAYAGPADVALTMADISLFLTLPLLFAHVALWRYLTKHALSRLAQSLAVMDILIGGVTLIFVGALAFFGRAKLAEHPDRWLGSPVVAVAVASLSVGVGALLWRRHKKAHAKRQALRELKYNR